MTTCGACAPEKTRTLSPTPLPRAGAGSKVLAGEGCKTAGECFSPRPLTGEGAPQGQERDGG
jgi:hypothetical protein